MAAWAADAPKRQAAAKLDSLLALIDGHPEEEVSAGDTAAAASSPAVEVSSTAPSDGDAQSNGKRKDTESNQTSAKKSKA